MNAITWLGRKPPTPKYTPSSIGSADAEASQEAVRGYSRSRVRNAERLAAVSAKYGTFGLAFGGVWMMMWIAYPRQHDVNHWILWDGTNRPPHELPDPGVAIKNAPQAINIHFAAEYVLYRERFYYDLFLDDRMHVSYQTGREEMQDYNAAIDPKNPDAPVNDPGKNGFIQVAITGSDLEYNKETDRYHSKVYFTRRVQRYGAAQALAVQMLADFTWEKHPENVPETARTYSPIGMVVVHYNRQKEGAR